jgi:hypothetical protein
MGLSCSISSSKSGGINLTWPPPKQRDQSKSAAKAAAAAKAEGLI